MKGRFTEFAGRAILMNLPDDRSMRSYYPIAKSNPPSPNNFRCFDELHAYSVAWKMRDSETPILILTPSYKKDSTLSREILAGNSYLLS